MATDALRSTRTSPRSGAVARLTTETRAKVTATETAMSRRSRPCAPGSTSRSSGLATWQPRPSEGWKPRAQLSRRERPARRRQALINRGAAFPCREAAPSLSRRHRVRSRFAQGLRGHVLLMGLRSDREQFGQSGSLAGQLLVQCAGSCEEALREYASGGLPPGHDLFHELLPAIATARTAVDLLKERDSRRELALHLALDACKRASAQCLRYGFDTPLLRCAVACDRAVNELELLLTSLAHE